MEDRTWITTEPGKRGGTLCIRGPHITVSGVLDYLTQGFRELSRCHPASCEGSPPNSKP